MLGGRAGRVSWARWGEVEGRSVTRFDLTAPDGATATLTDFGATLVGLTAPDRAGGFGDVVLGHDRFDPYRSLETAPYLGSTIGRYANRIAGGRFELDGIAYDIDRNEPPNSLHGGAGGFHHRLWEATPSVGDLGPAVLFGYLSPAGEQGFPGNLTVSVTYRLTAGPTLTIDYRATTDAPTVVNLTNHAYFNLAGRGSIDEHVLRVDADSIVEVDDASIPTGRLVAVEGTRFDLREPTRVSAERFDHSFVLGSVTAEPRRVAELSDPASGRRLTVSTTEPAVQFYTGDHIGDAVATGPRSGLCLETQHFPDSPNQRGFPSTVLRPGEEFTSTTVLAFTHDG